MLSALILAILLVFIFLLGICVVLPATLRSFTDKLIEEEVENITITINFDTSECQEDSD